MRLCSLTFAACLWAGCASEPQPREPFRVPQLRNVTSWACQLQGLERPGALTRIERARTDLIVLDPVRSIRGAEVFPTRTIVSRIRSSPGAALERKICLAYLNIGQAEDYRTYWAAGWRAPTDTRRGEPNFLLRRDPEGWEGNFPIAYWDTRWERILFGSSSALLDQIISDGFDGVYLDWVLGYEDPLVAAAAAEAGIDPARAMAELIRDLRKYARARNPHFVIVAQNGALLPARVPDVYGWIDGVSQESLSFGGEANADWDDPGSGDRDAVEDREALLLALREFRRRKIPVFTLDYAQTPANIRAALLDSATRGFVPFVSRTPLDRLPAHLFTDEG